MKDDEFVDAAAHLFIAIVVLLFLICLVFK